MITSLQNIKKLAFVICTECVFSEARNDILHEDVTYMTVCIRTVQIDFTRPSLNIHEFSKILAFKVKKELSDDVAQPTPVRRKGFYSQHGQAVRVKVNTEMCLVSNSIIFVPPTLGFL